MADLRQNLFSYTGHFHNGIANDAFPKHGSGNFQGSPAITL